MLDAGAVHTIQGAAGGLVTDGNTFWHQDRTDILNQADRGDGFGGALPGEH